jgi:hypothetical protein
LGGKLPLDHRVALLVAASPRRLIATA